MPCSQNTPELQRCRETGAGSSTNRDTSSCSQKDCTSLEGELNFVLTDFFCLFVCVCVCMCVCVRDRH